MTLTPLKLGFVLSAVLSAQAGTSVAFETHRERVYFKAGASSATVSGSIRGDGVADYLLGASAGQTMSVTLTTDKNAYINVTPPGSETAIFTGAQDATGSGRGRCQRWATTRCAST